ncbi:hypothetical protein C0J52_15567 [Blattella germanica]|nr:hypothetical protein C0J52_15567 [Blattella germanica]
MNPKTERPKEDEEPFKDLKIDNWAILDDINERQACDRCHKSRKYFCYNCYIPVTGLQNHIPKVKLPIKIDIIKHRREIDGKSTAAHAAVLAPEDVNIFIYPCIPDYGADENVVLVFPGKDPVSLESFFHSTDTWNQCRGIYKDQRLRELPCVVLQTRISQFWRHQKGSPRWYLATIEAIHQFLVELHTVAWNSMESYLESKTIEDGDKHGTDSKCSHENSDSKESKNFAPDTKVNCDKHEQISEENSSESYKETSIINPKKESDHSHEIDVRINSSNCFGPYNGEYDNLLFFFRYMYSKIHTLYEHDDLKAYKRRLK